nr:MAG TPA: hypothetical protein [Caudoviricetes sp.]
MIYFLPILYQKRVYFTSNNLLSFLLSFFLFLAHSLSNYE